MKQTPIVTREEFSIVKETTKKIEKSYKKIAYGVFSLSFMVGLYALWKPVDTTSEDFRFSQLTKQMYDPEKRKVVPTYLDDNLDLVSTLITRDSESYNFLAVEKSLFGESQERVLNETDVQASVHGIQAHTPDGYIWIRYNNTEYRLHDDYLTFNHSNDYYSNNKFYEVSDVQDIGFFDINKDGKQEILFATDDRVYAFDGKEKIATYKTNIESFDNLTHTRWLRPDDFKKLLKEYEVKP